MRFVLIVLLVAAPALAKNDISNEVSLNSTQSTSANPRAGYVADSLAADFELNEHFSLSAGAVLTLEGQTPAASKGAFGASSSAVTLFSAGLEWAPDDHLTSGLTFDFSPQSDQKSGTVLNIQGDKGATVPVNALLGTHSGQSALGLDLGYDTAGDSDLEWAFTAGATFSRYDETQTIEQIKFKDTGRPADRAQLSAYCNTNPSPCSKALRSVLKAQPARLDALRASLEATATIALDTDVSLSGDYYFYAQDPTAAGIFSVGATGRQITGGNGVPIAPLQFLVKPEVLHRFGDFSARVWIQAGQYVAEAGGGSQGIGTRLQYKLTKDFKMWLTLSGQKDTDANQQESKSGGVALGARYSY